MGYNGYVSHSSLLLSFLSLWIQYIILYLVLYITLRQFYEYLAVYCFTVFEYPFKGNQTGYYTEKAIYASSHNDTYHFLYSPISQSGTAVSDVMQCERLRTDTM